VAEPVLLISSDPFLGANLEAAANRRVQVTPLDPAHRPPTWPAGPSTTVVLDVAAHHRDSIHTWIRHHHPGALVILLKPGERHPALPPDRSRVVVTRPFRLIDLVALLEDPFPPEEVAPARSRVPEPEPPPPDPGQALEGEPEPDPAHGGRELVGEVAPNPADNGPPLGRVTERRELFARLSTPPHLRRSHSPSRARVDPPIDPPPLEASDPIPTAEPAQAPEKAGQLPRPDWPTAATQFEAPRPHRPRRHGRRVATRVLLGVVVALVVGGGWLGLGLVEARQDLLVGAAGVRDELARAEAALARGEPEEAGAAVQAAQRSLQVAAAVPERREVRVAARLPVLAGGVADSRRLLAAAAGLTGAGERAVAMTPHLRAGPAALLRGDHFDLDALDDAAAQAKGLVAELEAARAQLDEVRGGPLEPGVDETRRWASGRLDEALGRARPLVATLEALPAAVGVGESRRYLVVLTSPAELRPAGGVPLAAREVVLDEGVIDLRPADSGLAEALRDTGASANFPTTGKAMLRAVQARGRPRPDGVIALDPLAMRKLLEATGPVAVPGYGRIGAADAVAKLTRDADLRWPSQDERGRYHQAVLATLVARFLSGNDLVATGRALAAAGAGRNVQVYAADPGLQRMLAGHRLDGALADPGDGDYLAVHTTNRNRSRVDLFQRRSIRQVVQLARDGSAQVTRTVKVLNAVPAGRSAGTLATILPPGAELGSVTLDGRPVRPEVAAEQGRPVVRVGIDLGPGRAATLAVGYRLRPAGGDGGGRRYRLTADPQVLLDPPVLRVEVTAPPGMAPAPTDGWTVQDGARSSPGA
jgi:hypothetical protein